MECREHPRFVELPAHLDAASTTGKLSFGRG
jgi:hypothetical protein